MQAIFKTFFKASLSENKAKWHFIPSHIIYFKALIMTGEYKKAAKLPFTNGKEQDGPLFWTIKDYYTLHLLQATILKPTGKVNKKQLLQQYHHTIISTNFKYFSRLLK